MLNIERLESSEINQEFNTLLAIVIRAFSGFPWFESLSSSEASQRLEEQKDRQGSQIFVAKNEDSKIIATSWLDTPSLDQLEKERGPQLRQFTETTMKQQNVGLLLWERELLVDLDYQKQGVGTELRTYVMTLIDKIPGKTIVLTRMRDDNIGTIKIAERLGFQRTGITKVSSQTPDFNHEYWYRVGGK